MRSWRLAVFLATLAVTLACRLGSSAVPTNPSAGGLVAEAKSPLTIHLTWTPIRGAESYRIEARSEESDYSPLADVPPDRTQYDVFLLPDTPPLTFRVLAVTASGETEAGTAGADLPEYVPNPLVVEVQPFEMAMGAMPTFDPENPFASLPPGFDPEDPETFDFSSLLQDPAVAQTIGPEGGTVSVTSPDQVTYTLEMPAGALDQEMILKLTPIESITGFPLSGGMLGAVQIQPEGAVFNLPARLSIERSAASGDSGAPLTLGFAVAPLSREFFLYPMEEPARTGLDLQASGHRARAADRPLRQGGSSSMNVGAGGTYGVGAGSAADVSAQSGRAPSGPGAQVAQSQAQQRVMNPGIGAYEQTGFVIHQSLLSSSSAETVARAASQLEQYWQDRGSEYNDASNAALIDTFASRVKSLLSRAKGDCLTRDDLVAAELAGKLNNAASDFWRRVRESYDRQAGAAGQKLLDDLVKGKLSCTFTLEINSTIRSETDSGWSEVTVVTDPPITLWHRQGGADKMSATNYRLYGDGWVRYTKYEFQVKRCPVTKVTQYPRVSLWVAGLFPEFDRQGPVRDFWWRDMEIGANYTLDIDLAVSEDKKGCNRQVLIGGGGEPWAGGFIPLHFPSPNAGLRGWTQTTTGYPLVFTKTYTDYTIALPEGAGTLTENATYTLTISRASAQ